MRYIDIYCDGACSGNGATNAVGGAAAMAYEDDNNILSWTSHLDNTTNNICELTAAKLAITMGKLLGGDTIFRIYTDSAYIHNCYAQGWYKKWQTNGWKTAGHKPVANRELWEEIIPYFEDSHFEWYKVQGHANDARNNAVDKLAVAAKTQEGMLNVIDCFPNI